MLDTNLLDRFTTLTREKRELEAKLRMVQDELNGVMPALLDSMAESGVQSIKSNDGATVYMARNIFARPVDAEALCQALERTGYGDIISRGVHHKTLNAFVKEFEGEGGEVELPQEIADQLDLTTVYQVRMRG